jgi:hypothetical protein
LKEREFVLMKERNDEKDEKIATLEEKIHVLRIVLKN